MITVGDFIVSHLDIIYFVKAKGDYNGSYIFVPICSVIGDRLSIEFSGDILSSDKIITMNDLMNMKYIFNHELMNKAMEYLIERHRL